MIIKKRTQDNYVLFVLGLFLIILISACATKPTQGTKETETPIAGAGKDEEDFDLQISSCPDEKTLFYLLLDHQAVLNIDAGGGETFYLRWDNPPTSFFQVWIEPSGVVTNEGINIPIDITYHGTANHPNSDNCPVQTFDGIWSMDADISGTCKKDTVKLRITEWWIDPILHSSCGDPLGSGPGMVSAPELDLVFDLSEKFPTDGINSPPGGLFSSSYWYYLVPAGDVLPVVPLVPRIK